MLKEDLDRLREVFLAAWRLEDGARRGFLDDSCRDEPRLRADVESLLAERRSLGDENRAEWENSAIETGPEVGLGPHPLAFAPLAAGDVVGGFEIDSFLARGGTSEVYRARQLDLGGRIVALKVSPASSWSERERDRLLRECRLAAALHHPHLATVYSSGEDAVRGIVFYAMRLVEGPTLDDVLTLLAERRSRPAAADARAIVERCLEVASALAALHERGLVHGDVKPGNVVLESGSAPEPWRGRAVLVDFGLVRPIDRPVSTVWATPSYAPPEVLLGGAADGRADVYGLGQTLHDLLSGRRPESRSLPAAGRPSALSSVAPEVDPDLDAIVALATESEPSWRYSSVTAFARDLEAWLAGDPVSARSLGGIERARRWIFRHPARVLGWVGRAAVALIVLAIGSAAIVGTRTILVASADLHTRWEVGDLPAVRAQLASIPSFLDRALLPRELASRVGEFRYLTGDPGLARVVRSLAQDDVGAALRLAAATLESEGLDSSPVLVRYLLWAASSPRRAGPDAMEVIARLFFERPDESDEAVAASGPFRRRLVAMLGTETDADRLRHALTALAGAGTLRDVPTILDWLESRAEAREPNFPEELRIALLALGQIVRRSIPCGTAGEIAALNSARLFDVASTLARSVGLDDAQRHTRLSGPWIDLYANVAIARRAAGLPPLTDLPGMGDFVVLCARADPGQKRAIEEGGPLLFRAEDKIPSTYPDLETAGRLAALFDDTDFLADLRRRAVDLAHADSLDADAALETFDEGARIGALVLAGLSPDHKPDEDTRLARLIDRSSAPPVAVELPVVEVDDPALIGSWNFVDSRLETGAAPIALAVALEEDLRFSVPGAGYVRLGLAGHSEIHLRYEIGPDLGRGTLQLRLRFQKALRPLLPECGRAAIDVEWDGLPNGSALPTTLGGPEEIVLPLRRPIVEAVRDHTVTLRLNEESTTTIWVKSAEIRLIP